MRFFRDLLLALLACAAVLLLLECGLRLAHVRYEASLYQPEQERGFSLRPNAAGWNVSENECYVHINGDGMRDRERPVPRPPNSLRIAIIGSSEAEAQQVPLERTLAAVFNRRLEQALAPSGHPVDVLNFAVPGYTFSQEYLTLHNHVWKYDPQVVVFVLSTFTILKNTRDLFPGDPKGTPFYVLKNGRLEPDEITRLARPLNARRVYWKNFASDWMNRSSVLCLFNEARIELAKQVLGLTAKLKRAQPAAAAAARTLPSDYVDRWIYMPDLPDTQQAWAIGEAFLDAMQLDCSHHGAEFWIVISDEVMQSHPSLAERTRFLAEKHLTSLAASDQRIQRFAETHRIPVIPLAPPLAEYAATHGVALHGFPDTRFGIGHWNELGNELAGEALAQEFLKRSPVARAWISPAENTGADRTFR